MKNYQAKAGILMIGAGVLLFRTISMVYHSAFGVLMPWVASTILIEMIVDVLCLALSIKWLLSDDGPRDSKRPLQVGAACTLIHAFRVFMFCSRTVRWISQRF
jgi:hypothetical protein